MRQGEQIKSERQQNKTEKTLSAKNCKKAQEEEVNSENT